MQWFAESQVTKSEGGKELVHLEIRLEIGGKISGKERAASCERFLPPSAC